MEPEKVEEGPQDYAPTVQKTTTDHLPHSGSKEEQQKLQYLASNISITGIKFILGRDATPARRCVWLMFILAAVTWMAWNIGQQVALFLSNPTSVSSSVTVHDVITFPQVTLCNQNPSAESNGVDKFMSQYGDLLHGVDMANFMWSTAQDKATFIQSCKWRGRKCGPDAFKSVLTNQGVCYRFVPDDRNVDIAGVRGGLEVTLLVEQHDYSSSGRRAAGVRLSVADTVTGGHEMDVTDSRDHLRHTPVFMDEGLTLPAGAVTSVGLKVGKTTDLPPPYGQCGERPLVMLPRGTTYTQGACHLDCLTQHLNNTCTCVEPHLPCAPDTCRRCSLLETLMCAKPQTEAFYSHGLATQCDCPPQCFSTTYTPTLSSAPLSQVFINSLAVGQAPVDPGNVERMLAIQLWAHLNRMSPHYTDLLEDVVMATRRLVDTVWRLSTTLEDLANSLASLKGRVTVTGVAATTTANLCMDSTAYLNPLLWQRCREESRQQTTAEDPLVNLEDETRIARSTKKQLVYISNKPLSSRPGWELQLTLLSGSFKGLAILDRFILFVNNTILHYLRNDFASVKTLNDSLFKILHDPTNDAEKENISRAVDALEALKSNLDCNANAWQQVDSTKRRFLNTAPIQLLQDVSREQSNVNTNKLNTTDVDVELETLNREFYEHNTVTVQVFLDSMAVQQTTKAAAYQTEALVCDIGGSLGLCLGGSVLTFIEVIDLVLFIFNKRKQNQ
ncbi:hypothetical protein BaRGS_00007189 [Batillaria attramentaria]|uniref:Uncharacterized protein n=1 Tax=Batillaria attramentaria TaxID=370345 RepID=A0ABD0LQM8_9CAEN